MHRVMGSLNRHYREIRVILANLFNGEMFQFRARLEFLSGFEVSFVSLKALSNRTYCTY